MTLFARYYENRRLIQVSMDDISEYIQNEKNKEKIADSIFHRYYDRYLKIFDYKSTLKFDYTNGLNVDDKIIRAEEFTKEYKSGFVIMGMCCILIETISTFFEGQNESRKPGPDTFRYIFEKAKYYNNPLECFIAENQFYKSIRCGLLHQGETYSKFKIKRNGPLFDKQEKSINAQLFFNATKKFLNSYRDDLKSAKWDSDLWDKCRVKLRFITDNSNK